MEKWQKIQKVIFFIFIFLIVLSLFLYGIIKDGTNFEQIRQYLKDAGILAPIIFISFYTLGTIFIPSTPFMAIAGVFFGFKYGLIYTIIGGFISSLFVFILSRKLGKKWVETILEHQYMKKLDDYNKKLESGAIFDLIIFRMAPIMPFNVLNILMGISRISVRDYIIGTLLGLIPSNIIAVYFGNTITKIF